MSTKRYAVGSEHRGAVVVHYDPNANPDYILRCPCQATFAAAGSTIAAARICKTDLRCSGCRAEQARARRASRPARRGRNICRGEPANDRVIHGVALLKAGELSASAIAEKLHVTNQTVRGWYLRWVAEDRLQDENARLQAENDRLRNELTEMESKILKLFKGA